MKFAALALALLLAVGSQAASLQADAPSPLEHVRAAVNVYLTQLKEGTNRALQQLEGTEYSEYRGIISQYLDNAETRLKSLQTSVSPYTDSAVSTVADATAEFRMALVNDLTTLRNDLEPMRANLRTVLEKHFDEYRTTLMPVLQEMHERHTSAMELMKTKIDTAVEEMRGQVATNVEETKAALIPILDAVRAKAQEHLESLRSMVSPYVEEYKEQMRHAVQQAQTINADELPALREKIAPLAEDIKVKLQAIFEAIAATVTKN